MKIYFILFILAILSFNATAQQQTVKETNETKSDVKPLRQAVSVSHPVNLISVDENDEYYGRKEEFARLFTSNTLPLDFPKFQKGSDVDDYNIRVKAFLRENSALLTEKSKEKYGN